MRARTANAAVILIAAAAAQMHAQQTKIDPTSIYEQQRIEGFTILINPEVLRHRDEAAQMREQLESQLAAINRVVPDKRLAALKKVRIWVEWEKRPAGAAEFHVSSAWLKANGYNTEKVGCVELSNTRNFVKWSRGEQPWMVLHELAHALHNLVLGANNVAIHTAYRQAVSENLYDSVDYIQGGKKKAYAITNAQEYFAELSEAYFGKNDFYPYTRAELKNHDPVGYQLMIKMWGEPQDVEHVQN